MRKQKEFLWREVQRNARARCLVPLNVELQIFDAQMLRLLLGSAPQHRPDTSEQFRKREWFDQIVVCTQLQSFHPIADAIACGEKQNRRTDFIAAKFRDHIPAVLVRQHNVDDEKIKFGRKRLFYSAFAIHRDIDSKPGFAQSFGKKSGGFLFVLDHQNARRAHCLYVHATHPPERRCEGGTAISSPAIRNVIAAENKQYRQYACSRNACTYSSQSVIRNIAPAIKTRNFGARGQPTAANVA